MAKGGEFENEVSRDLSLWVTNGVRDDIFGRSDGSGSRFTARKKKGKDTANMAGDITFTDELGIPLISIWNLEAKTGYGDKQKIKDKSGTVIKNIQTRWDILDNLDSNSKITIFFQMWNQCQRDADMTARIPVLILRRNRRPKCIAIRNDYFLSLRSRFGDFKKMNVIINEPEKEICINVMNLKDFFAWIPGDFLATKPTNCDSLSPLKFNRSKIHSR